MKKILRRIAAILGLLLLSFFAFVWYKTASSFKTQIPQQTSSVIRINTYGIFKSIAFSYLTDPGRIFSTRKSKGPSTKSGITIAANQFIVTVPGIPNTFFTTLELSDSKKFDNYLRKKFRIEIRDSSDPANVVASSADKKITVVFSEDKAAIAYSFPATDVVATLRDLVAEKNTIDFKKSKWAEVGEKNDHVLFADDKNQAALNFNKGEITGTAQLMLSGWTIPSAPQSGKLTDETAFYTWLSASPGEALKGKTFDTRSFSLSGDSLQKYFHNYIDFRLAGTITQQDSIITYGYNDDFEKTEQVELKETVVPGAVLSLQGDTKGLLHYLAQQQMLTNGSDTINRAVFPLYRLYTDTSGSRLGISTAKALAAAGTVSENNDHFFGLYINFNRLARQKQVPLLSGYIHPFSELEVKAKQISGQQVALSLRLGFNKNSRHSLRELMDNF